MGKTKKETKKPISANAGQAIPKRILMADDNKAIRDVVSGFFEFLGYEVADAPFDPNFTRSYGWSIEPVNHTGLLMSYQFSDLFSASAGHSCVRNTGTCSRWSRREAPAAAVASAPAGRSVW